MRKNLIVIILLMLTLSPIVNAVNFKESAGSFNFETVLDISDVYKIISDYMNVTSSPSSSGSESFYEVENNITSRNVTFYDTSIFTIPLLANTNYTFECRLIGSSNGTTSGVQINSSFPLNPRYLLLTYNHPTTATAPNFKACYNNTKNECIDASLTSVLAGIPIEINGHINNKNAGNWSIRLKSELNNSLALITKGSYCSIKVNNP